MKKILGLDVGTNSIGGALISVDAFGVSGKIDWIGSRIIPMDGKTMSEFQNGSLNETKAALRRQARGSRRLKHRYKLRRSRLTKVFKILGWVKEDFPSDFKKLVGGQKFNINDHFRISDKSRNEAFSAFGTDKISEDWIIYFLRKKALDSPVTLPELARILYMLNQRRGFKSSRKDIKLEAENPDDKWPKFEKWLEIQTVSEVKYVSSDGEKALYEVKAGPYVGQILRNKKPEWEGKQMELEITKKTTKSGEEQYTFKLPDTTDWEKQKSALHNEIERSVSEGQCRTVGEYFFLQLYKDKNYRIRQRIVDRSWYRKEIELIWTSQIRFHPELTNNEHLAAIATELYKSNKQKQEAIKKKDLFNVIANDIIYYQRPLKSQKATVDNCPFEKRLYRENGELLFQLIKVAPKSSPESQEFRIWQDIHNIRILKETEDVTDQFLNAERKYQLFLLFENNQELSQSAVLKCIDKSLNSTEYRVNLFANREKLKGNETKAMIRRVFKKTSFAEGEQLLSEPKKFRALWHILYSLDDEKDISTALRKISLYEGGTIPEDVISHLARLPEFPKQYSAYSSKALKKLLPLMRCGDAWNLSHIDEKTTMRISKILDAEVDDTIDDNTRQMISKRNFTKAEDFAGLPVWLATYVVYGKHAEKQFDGKYSYADEIDVHKLLPPNSLRNPIVEQILRETLQLVKEICKRYGQPDEIHVELARDLKKNAEERAKISAANNKNLAEKERIKRFLRELKTGNPDSLSDIEKFRLWKENGGLEGEKRFVSLFNAKNDFINQSEVEVYRLWAEQNYVSPYTGRPIPLSKLFDKSQYEVEHIFPRKRFFDDSAGNKVICETGVNKLKDVRIARLFIQQFSGRTVEWGGQKFSILDEESYIDHCKSTFRGKKLKNLLAETIPNDFLSRQLNDTRHISRKLAELLDPVAKEKQGLIFTGGAITSELKEKWGLNKVWKEILRPRFERLELITGEKMVIEENDRNKFHFARDYKRVDHRHHALDALIIAGTTRAHIQYLNTLNASEDPDRDLLRNRLVRAGVRDFVLPWPTFTQEAKSKLEEVIVSHKVNNRLVTKPFNKYFKWVERNGTFVKEMVTQQSPAGIEKNWTAVRKSMFKEPQGVIFLKEIVLKKIPEAISIQFIKEQTENKKGMKPADYIYDQTLRPKIKELIKEFQGNQTEILAHLKKSPLLDAEGQPVKQVQVAVFKEYAAKRVALDPSFDEKKIAKIPYAHHKPSDGKKATLPQILKQHLREYGKPQLAFAGEGLEMLHKKIGHPLRKVTIYESKDPQSKFRGSYYETDKGGNLFFVIKEDEAKNRIMYTLPLMEAIQRKANRLPLVDPEPGFKSFVLSPNDLVYVPEPDQHFQPIDWTDKKRISARIYKMVSCTENSCFFIPHNVSELIVPYNPETKIGEFGSKNKSETTTDGVVIKRHCTKVKIDRLCNIEPLLL